MKTKAFILALAATVLYACSSRDGEYEFQILSTNDIHGTWFDSTYTGGKIKNSLFAINYYVDSIRQNAGKNNVILVDAGDCLQGDNAAYYYNYVDTLSPHLFPRLVDYMKYDAIVVGNHDIETGHAVYDRINKELKDKEIPFLAGNAIRNDNGKPYFCEYKTITRNGIKITILGFTNPNIKAWLNEELWSGMKFKSLIPLVQEEVDNIKTKENPHITIVAIHSGTGKGDGSIYESQGMDLFNTLEGVDFIICSHDHRPCLLNKKNIALINSGSHSKNLGHGTIKLEIKDNKVVNKSISSELIKVHAEKADKKMQKAFLNDFKKIKKFTLQETGELKTDLNTIDAYKGMSDYINLIHTLALSCNPAQISFAAPLTYNGQIKSGKLVYNDLFTIYPYENSLYIVKMNGKEIKNYLEYSYDQWINTVKDGKDHALKIAFMDDPRNNQKRWSFINRSYNFDSAAGICYTVDITKNVGDRIKITKMANGEEFDLRKTYNVAMTSYRASGGGDLLDKGAKIDTDNIEERIVTKYPEIRNLLYNYIKEYKSIDPEVIGNPEIIGHWEFIPKKLAEKTINKDMELLFGEKQ